MKRTQRRNAITCKLCDLRVLYERILCALASWQEKADDGRWTMDPESLSLSGLAAMEC